LDNLPQIFSISSGDPETGLCTYVTDCGKNRVNTARKYINRAEVEFMKLAVRGITVLVASGDDGANSYAPHYNSDKCTNKVFYPGYLATSAFITSVGATELVNVTHGTLRDQPPICLELTASYKCAAGGKEVAVGKYYVGGGGFSRFIPQPSYQKDAVNHYFHNSECHDSEMLTTVLYHQCITVKDVRFQMRLPLVKLVIL
jgi:subtilase family serine protease